MKVTLAVALLLASTALVGVASPAALLCASTLPSEMDCVGAGGTCGKDVFASWEANADLACASRGNDPCDELGRWTVRASFAKGSGTLSISAICGSTSVASCATDAAAVPCEDVGDSGTGKFKCFILLDGDIDPADVKGECIDPVDPARVVQATVLVADHVLTR